MKIPPLNPLRAFEAAARHNSYPLAAAELGVTSGAISRQVRTLEDHLGFPLFVRVHNGIAVTQEGRQYQQCLHEALLKMETSTRELLDTRGEQPLRVWCAQLFMRQWLVPRLPSFQEAHPLQEVFLTEARSREMPPNDADLAIRWGRKPPMDWHEDHLLDSHLIPVCSPDYARNAPPLHEPVDLLDHTLLASTTRPDDWLDWLTSAGVKGGQPGRSKEVLLGGSGLCYRAAVEGMGIALGRLEFVDPDLDAGRLILPFLHTHKLGSAFYLLYPRAASHQRKVVRFRDWVLKEARNPSSLMSARQANL